MSTLEAIIEKVKKLVALAEDSGASEGEVENALRMAHRLLAKHNLSMADLDYSTNVDIDEACLFYRNRTWIRAVISHVSKLFFCTYIVQEGDPRSRTRHYVIGGEANRAVACYISEYVLVTIQKRA